MPHDIVVSSRQTDLTQHNALVNSTLSPPIKVSLPSGIDGNVFNNSLQVTVLKLYNAKRRRLRRPRFMAKGKNGICFTVMNSLSVFSAQYFAGLHKPELQFAARPSLLSAASATAISHPAGSRLVRVVSRRLPQPLGV